MNQKSRPISSRSIRAGVVTAVLLASTACMVGPNYRRPPAPVPTAFKEKPPEGWKEAQPSDAALKGKWWEIYNDATLNALEEQVSISNQNVLQAEAQYRAARATVQIARSALFPTVTAGPSASAQQGGTGAGLSLGGGKQIFTSYEIPADVTYTPDLWGSIHRTVRANAATSRCCNPPSIPTPDF